jgi:hypothetical protein
MARTKKPSKAQLAAAELLPPGAVVYERWNAIPADLRPEWMWLKERRAARCSTRSTAKTTPRPPWR